jgi:hypothetical protein
MKKGIAKYPKPDPNHKKNVKLATNTHDKSLFGNSNQTIPIENSFISEGNIFKKFPTDPNQDEGPPCCQTHSKEIEFICLSHLCYKELCGHCILEHVEHIGFIKGIKGVLQETVSQIQVKNFLSEIKFNGKFSWHHLRKWKMSCFRANGRT